VLHRFGRRRLADKRVVLIPNQWNGSVQQYYHFLLGYLAPVLAWADRNPSKPIAVRDCGPMNRWFELLKPECDLEIMTVGDVLHVLAGNLQPNRVLQGMDYPDRFSRQDIVAFADRTRQIAHERCVDALNASSIVVSDRASSDEFFATPAAEWPESGSQKRSVPNLRETINPMTASDIRILDAARTDVYEQILVHTHARVLIGQHGAGLTNMIWMKPGSFVIEILPPMPADAQNIFRNLARTLGINYLVVQQASVHAPIDARELISAIETARDQLALG